LIIYQYINVNTITQVLNFHILSSIDKTFCTCKHSNSNDYQILFYKEKCQFQPFFSSVDLLHCIKDRALRGYIIFAPKHKYQSVGTKAKSTVFMGQSYECYIYPIYMMMMMMIIIVIITSSSAAALLLYLNLAIFYSIYATYLISIMLYSTKENICVK
jgi:hypothetical protein